MTSGCAGSGEGVRARSSLSSPSCSAHAPSPPSPAYCPSPSPSPSSYCSPPAKDRRSGMERDTCDAGLLLLVARCRGPPAWDCRLTGDATAAAAVPMGGSRPESLGLRAEAGAVAVPGPLTCVRRVGAAHCGMRGHGTGGSGTQVFGRQTEGKCCAC